MLALAIVTGRGSGPRRPLEVGRAVAGYLLHGREIFASVCEAGALLAGRLGLGERVAARLPSSSSAGTARVDLAGWQESRSPSRRGSQ